jgi:hypothetical protein
MVHYADYKLCALNYLKCSKLDFIFISLALGFPCMIFFTSRVSKVFFGPNSHNNSKKLLCPRLIYRSINKGSVHLFHCWVSFHCSSDLFYVPCVYVCYVYHLILQWFFLTFFNYFWIQISIWYTYICKFHFFLIILYSVCVI